MIGMAILEQFGRRERRKRGFVNKGSERREGGVKRIELQRETDSGI